jgi:hypothetical protein
MGILKFAAITLVLCFLAMSSMLYAACTGSSPTWTSTPDYESVNACIQGASENDTVYVTSGDGSEIWSSVLNIPRTINLVGPGRDSLVITLGVSSSTYAIRANSAWSGGSISGFEFFTDNDYPAIYILGTGWRIHHNRYRNTQEVGGNGVFVLADSTLTNPAPEGLVDNNEIINGKILSFGASSFANQSARWEATSKLGTVNSVYVENNNISMTWNGSGNCMDANYSGRYVFRYNSVIQTTVEAHGLQAEGTRGTREWEVYGNTFNSFGNLSYAAASMRGGTGNIFCNDTSSTVDYNYLATFEIDRDTRSVGVGGTCNGSSIWDEKTSDGWLCRDQIGAGKDAVTWSSYTTTGPVQEKTPAYAWSNYNKGVLQSPTSLSTHIQENRDYYTHTASFNGTSGVGCGTLANLQSAEYYDDCEPGVGYWATNQKCDDLTGMVGVNPSTPISGTLYKCNAEGTGWEPYYTPYTYPHPLRVQKFTGNVMVGGAGLYN